MHRIVYETWMEFACRNCKKKISVNLGFEPKRQQNAYKCLQCETSHTVTFIPSTINPRLATFLINEPAPESGPRPAPAPATPASETPS